MKCACVEKKKEKEKKMLSVCDMNRDKDLDSDTQRCTVFLQGQEQNALCGTWDGTANVSWTTRPGHPCVFLQLPNTR